MAKKITPQQASTAGTKLTDSKSAKVKSSSASTLSNYGHQKSDKKHKK